MEHFCTCTHDECALRPEKHDQGCDLCIQKNLKQGEIPTCFFRVIHEDLQDGTDSSFDGFVKYFLEHKETYVAKQRN